MCNEVARRIALGQLREDWSELKVPLGFPEGLPNLAALDSIRITDPTLILRAGPDGVEGTIRRWSWPGPGGKPVYNYRSEGRAFANAAASPGSPQGGTVRGGAGRCLIPVDAFYEFTDRAPLAPAGGGGGGDDLFSSASGGKVDGPPLTARASGRAKGRKDKWRFTHADGAWFCIAGFWRSVPELEAGPAPGERRAGEAFTLLTCEPGPDIAPYHHRQIVLPPREQWLGWLDGSLPAAAVCRPTPGGTLAVERAG